MKYEDLSFPWLLYARVIYFSPFLDVALATFCEICRRKQHYFIWATWERYVISIWSVFPVQGQSVYICRVCLCFLSLISIYFIYKGAFIIYVRIPREGGEVGKISTYSYFGEVGLGGLGVPCSPRDPRFAGLNPSEVDGFFQDVKILSTSPPGGTLSWGSRV